ncbi:MAG: VWA domain-containing protein, partial [Planctomycetia bacterium]|nr:VWA domain-containing protein [Planctomycetia bacterium]
MNERKSTSRILMVVGLFLFAGVWMLLMGLLSLAFGGRAAAGVAPVDDGSVKAQVSSLERGKDFDIGLSLKITDKAGKIIEGLNEQDIEIYEDGELVATRNFQPAGKGSIRLSLVLDATRTMNQGGKWPEAIRASRALLLMMDEHDSVGLFCVNDNLYDNKQSERFKLEPVTRLHLLNAWDAIRGTGLGEGTPLCKTIERAMDSLTKVSGRRAMIVLSDGMDNSGEAPEVEQLKRGVIAKSQELKIPLYMVCTSSGQADMKSLEEMAVGSPGGEFHSVPDPKKLKEIFEKIGQSLQNEYTLNYTSPHPVEDGLKRNVTAFVRSGPVGTQAKGDYNVPGVISTGGGARRAGGGTAGSLGLGSLALIFVSLTALIGLLFGFSQLRLGSGVVTDEAPAALAAPTPSTKPSSH